MGSEYREIGQPVGQQEDSGMVVGTCETAEDALKSKLGSSRLL